MDKDDLLHMIGLERRKEATDWLLPTLGAFSVGMLVGAGIGLLLAPKPGAELRSDLRSRLHSGGQEGLANGEQHPEQQPVARSA
ncbi:MAG TPA: YtxH domain-containing protein [Myxococcaceae bacterium]|nr:YtxH domain-containing protein [Myxococcaceae bacterium]